MPGGRPLASHWKGARPPPETNACSTHGTPNVQSSKKLVSGEPPPGATDGSDTGRLTTVSAIVFVVDASLESVTVTLNCQWELPTCGVPEMVPAGDIDSPGGRKLAV